MFYHLFVYLSIITSIREAQSKACCQGKSYVWLDDSDGVSFILIIGIHWEVEEHGAITEKAEDAPCQDHRTSPPPWEEEGERTEHEASNHLAKSHENTTERGEGLPVRTKSKGFKLLNASTIYTTKHQSFLPFCKSDWARVDSNSKRLVNSGEEHSQWQKKYSSRKEKTKGWLQSSQHWHVCFSLDPWSRPHQERRQQPRGGHPGDDGPQQHPGLLHDDLLVLEHEERNQVSHEARAHVHGPEYSRVSSDCVRIRIISQNWTLNNNRHQLFNLHSWIPNLSWKKNGRSDTNDDWGNVDWDGVEVEILGDVEHIGQGGEQHRAPGTQAHHQQGRQPAGQREDNIENAIPGKRSKQSGPKVVDLRHKSVDFKHSFVVPCC